MRRPKVSPIFFYEIGYLSVIDHMVYPVDDDGFIPSVFKKKTFDELQQEGLLSYKGVYEENIDLLKKMFPLDDGEVIVSVVSIYTMTLALTTHRLIGMMGARPENLTFITIEFEDIDPASIKPVKYKVHFTVKDHQFSVPNNQAKTFDVLLKHFVRLHEKI